MECPPLVLDLLPDGRTDEVDGVGYVEIGEGWTHVDMHGFGYYAFSQGWDPRAASRYFREVVVLMPVGRLMVPLPEEDQGTCLQA